MGVTTDENFLDFVGVTDLSAKKGNGDAPNQTETAFMNAQVRQGR